MTRYLHYFVCPGVSIEPPLSNAAFDPSFPTLDADVEALMAEEEDTDVVAALTASLPAILPFSTVVPPSLPEPPIPCCNDDETVSAS
mmetsp:Transcript_4130/g.5512  ORF Transcript_4130/g.5512 Transcript_4130/m.5512 type:complete len:87 (-) Transcript_4130:886-1146(-)